MSYLTTSLVYFFRPSRFLKSKLTPRIHRTASYDAGGRALTREFGPFDWATGSAPAVNSRASAVQATGGAGVRNVVTNIYVGISASSIAPPTTSTFPQSVALRDGAPGGGTIKWIAQLSVPATAGANENVVVPHLAIRMSANTETTLEFLGASGASTYQTVSFSGFTIQE